MRHCVDIGAQNWVGAGPINFPLVGLKSIIGERLSRVSAIIVDFHFDITTGVGGGCTAWEIMDWISMIILKTKWHTWVPGMSFSQMATLRMMQGFFFDGIGAVDIAASQANDISNIRMVIPFERPQLLDGRDLSEPASRLWDGNLGITMGAAAINVDTTVNALTIHAHAEISKSESLKAPLFFEDNAVQGLLSGYVLPAGIITELAIADHGIAAAAELTNLRIVAAGEAVLGSNIPDNVLSQFLYDVPFAAQFIGGHDFTCDHASLGWFPLIWTIGNYKGQFSDAVDTLGQPLALDCDGTNVPVYVFRRYVADPDRAQSTVVESEGGQPSTARVSTRAKSGVSISAGAKKATRGASMIPAKIVGFTSVEGAGRLSTRLPILSK